MIEEVERMISRDAKAGNYKPSLLGKTKGLFYPRVKPVMSTTALEDILVLDISFYQVTADFGLMKTNGVDGTIIRAGQNLWEDSKAKIFMDGAKAAGMPFGSYWFFDSRVSPTRQAELWAKILEGYDTKLWIWADYEENYEGQWSGWDGFYQFLEACKVYMPNRKIGIYTGFYYWIEHSPNPITQSASLYYFAQYPLWLAWYTTDPTQVRIPRPWTEMTFWQYSSSGDGYYYGVGSREVDMNRFIGDDFYNTFGLNDNGNGGEEPMPEKPITYYMDLRTGYQSNIRSGPGTNYGIVGLLVGPTTVSITGQALDNPNDSYEWYEIVSPMAGFVAKTSSYENFRPAETAPLLPNTLYIGTLPDGSDIARYDKEA